MSRRDELYEIEGMLDAARAGSSRVLLLVGEAGVGKSWLCARAAERAQATGCRVLSTRGIESEAHMDYAGLLDVLSPLLADGLDQLARPRRRAVEAALRLDGEAEADPVALGIACLDLLAGGAESEPLLVIVDDAHWADQASVQALRFAARRLDRDRVGVLFAARPEAAARFAAPGFACVNVGELAAAEAQALLGELAGAALDESVARRIVAATGGNPLALEEAVRRLSTAQLSGRAALPDPLPTPDMVQRAFEERLRRLPETTQTALAVAAVAESAPPPVVTNALARLDLAPVDLDGAERSGLVTDRGVFVHPVMRTAALHTASVQERRLAHRAVSAAWMDAGDPERAAWHLGAAADGQDRAISEALAAAAHAARARGAAKSAANAFRRAAETADDDDVRARLLFEAAFDLSRSGDAAEALPLLDRLAESCRSPALRARVDLLRGQALWTSGRLVDACAVLVEGADRSAAGARTQAVTMLCAAAVTRSSAGDIGLGVRTAERAVELAHDGNAPDRASAQFALGWTQILAGRGDEGYPRLRESVGIALPRDRFAGTAVRPPFGQLACWMEDYDLARRDLDSAIADARRHGAISDLCYGLAAIAELEFRTGDWLAARAHGTEALELAAATDLHSGDAGIAIGVLEAVTGNVARARELFQSVLELCDRTGTLAIHANAGLGLLELGSGDPQRALRHLEETRRLVRQSGLGEPNAVQWLPDLVETLLRVGRTADADRALTRFDATAARTGRRWALATARRCRGMLADSGDVDDVFADAQRLARDVPSPFEHARLELSWGERLRRDGRRVEARRHLGHALDEFESLGATPWAERAEREIAASGARSRRRSYVRSPELTAQETNVALLVAEGLSNKDVAARLFLSPKTIEFHLGNVFQKLDVRTRTQLVHALGERTRPARDDAAARFPVPTRSRPPTSVVLRTTDH